MTGSSPQLIYTRIPVTNLKMVYPSKPSQQWDCPSSEGLPIAGHIYQVQRGWTIAAWSGRFRVKDAQVKADHVLRRITCTLQMWSVTRTALYIGYIWGYLIRPCHIAFLCVYWEMGLVGQDMQSMSSQDNTLIGKYIGLPRKYGRIPLIGTGKCCLS